MKHKRSFLLMLPMLLLALGACDIPAKRLPALIGGTVGSLNYYASYPGLSRDVPYVENGDPAQVLDIYRPLQDFGEPLPVFVFIHGGYWKSGDTVLYSLLGDALCPRGYVVVLVEYRVYPQVRYPAFMEDATAALNWVHANIGKYGGDPHRIVVSGHSAGSHMAALLLTHDRFRNLLAFPLTDIRGGVLLSGAFDFERDCLLDVDFVRKVMVNEEDFIDSQPIKHARPDVPPLLIVNGDRDPLTGEKQASRFAQVMKDAGADVRYLMIPGGDHHSVVLDMSPRRRGPTYQAVTSFIDEVSRADKMPAD